MSSTPSMSRGMGGGRIAVLIIGALLALIGLGLALGGGGLLVANQVLRDDDGFLTTSTERFGTSGRALATESLSVLEGLPVEIADERLATVRIRATASDPGRAVFVGIARADDVDRYLSGVDHDRIRSIDYDPFRVTTERRAGDATPQLPQSQAIWVAATSGSGEQSIRWDVTEGTWSVVVMNADASAGVDIDASVGARIRHLVAIGVGLLVTGLLLLGGAVAMIFFAARRPRPPDATDASVDLVTPIGGATSHTMATPTRPVVLEGLLDEGQSRWVWLVKWLLAIPHWIILVVLWIALWVLSVVAFFAILFTGRYPRGIFDFNLGVLRWTWRVEFYTYSALGTDRYPPFTLDDDPEYPARLDIAYPQRLSRGLVLVKWWLLAIPHYIIIAIFTGGWLLGTPAPWGPHGDGWRWQGAPGLIGVVVLIAGLAMLFAGRYPRGLFDLVMGLNRWVYRVVAYAGLMRDEYPPFRLDMGPREGPPSASDPAVDTGQTAPGDRSVRSD